LIPTDRKKRTAQYLKEASVMILDDTASEYFKAMINDIDKEK
jgi:hypothetical protein